MNDVRLFEMTHSVLFSEFLSIEVSGELGGHFSKNKKTLGQSKLDVNRVLVVIYL